MNMSAETDVDLRAIDMMRNARDMILIHTKLTSKYFTEGCNPV